MRQIGSKHTHKIKFKTSTENTTQENGIFPGMLKIAPKNEVD